MNKINIGNDLYLKGRIGWKGLSKNEYLKNGSYRIINATSLEDSFIDWRKCGYITKERYDESEEIKLNEKDILISKDGTLGKIGYVVNLDKPSTVASGIFVLRNVLNDILDTDYLYHFLKSKIFKDFVYRNKAVGSTINHLYQRDLEELEISIPNIKFQKKISALLNDLDTKILTNRKIISNIENFSKTLYDYWFVQYDFPNIKNKPCKASGCKMVWNEELKREIPEGWKIGTLLEIADFTNGLACQKYRPVDSKTLRVIKIKEMHEGFSQETEFTKSDIDSKYIIENGDILFSWSASLEVQIWTKGRGVLNQHIFKVTSKKYPKFFYYFQLVNYLNHFKMIAKSRKTTMGHITFDHLEQSRIIIPPKDLTSKLDEIISPLFSQLIVKEIENQHLIELKNWLHPMLMNGQIKVTN